MDPLIGVVKILAVVAAMLFVIRYLWRSVFGGKSKGAGGGRGTSGTDGTFGVAMLEAATIVSLCTVLPTGIGVGPVVPVAIFVGMTFALVLLPDLVRPLLGFVAGAIAFLRLAPDQSLGVSAALFVFLLVRRFLRP